MPRMASLVERPRAGGRSAWLLSFDVEGRRRSITFQSADGPGGGIEWQKTFRQLGAKRAYALFLSELESDADTPTVRDIVQKHIGGLTGITAGTRKDYVKHLDRSIAPYIGDLPATVLARPDEVAAWVNELQAGGRAFGDEKPRAPLSGKTIHNRFALLSAAAETAVRDGVIERNGIKGLALPDASPAEDADMLMLEPAEVASLLRNLDSQWHPLVKFTVGTGVRWGEVTALRKADFALARGEVSIKRAWKHDPDGAVLGPPKTPRSRRVIPLAPYLVELLTDHLAGVDSGAWAFRSPRGFVLRSGTFWERVWGPATGAALADPVLPLQRRPRFHDLRHTAASWWLREGEPIHQVQRWLGHESIVTTVDRYGHVVGADREGAARRMDGPLRKI
jgi:integrase